jgi:hypothetical protein
MQLTRLFVMAVPLGAVAVIGCSSDDNGDGGSGGTAGTGGGGTGAAMCPMNLVFSSKLQVEP